MEKDWGQLVEKYDAIKSFYETENMSSINEASTRFHIIDRFLREILNLNDNNINVEERVIENDTYADYVIRIGDETFIIEAKKTGIVFPEFTKAKKIKITSSFIKNNEINKAIEQVVGYAKNIENTNVVMVTNGKCWCFFNFKKYDENTYVNILFPFDNPDDARELFNLFSIWAIEKGSLRKITNEPLMPENKLIDKIKNFDCRIDRNNIADHISPALDYALRADAILESKETLEKCFVITDDRTKYDNNLKIYITDNKPKINETFKRIKKSKDKNVLHDIIKTDISSMAPPVTLIIGPVGVGKTTFLHYFRYISGKELIEKSKVHWIYIDFEKLGKGGNVRNFIYSSLNDYLLKDNTPLSTDYSTLIKPAYDNKMASLLKGPFGYLKNDKEGYNNKFKNILEEDFKNVEPYVDCIYSFLGEKDKCVIIMDNIDLYEDVELEKTVLSEGLALSKKVKANVLISIRDKTFVKHKFDSVFDAYELRQLWLDPPPFKEVLSKRLIFSENLLKDKQAEIVMDKGFRLKITDLSKFFDIVQRSILQNESGNFVDYIADNNIRKGLTLINNFLKSGHIQADRALKSYITDDNYKYRFPFHEVFKGTMLSQWKHFKEDRSYCVNLFDAKLGSHNLKLLRLQLLKYLYIQSTKYNLTEISIDALSNTFKVIGATSFHIITVSQFLDSRNLLRNITSEEISEHSSITLTRSGAYYISNLIRQHVYVEECIFDTAIDDC